MDAAAGYYDMDNIEKGNALAGFDLERAAVGPARSRYWKCVPYPSISQKILSPGSEVWYKTVIVLHLTAIIEEL